MVGGWVWGGVGVWFWVGGWVPAHSMPLPAPTVRRIAGPGPPQTWFATPTRNSASVRVWVWGTGAPARAGLVAPRHPPPHQHRQHPHSTPGFAKALTQTRNPATQPAGLQHRVPGPGHLSTPGQF
jgi:hypothetical protein